MKRRWTVFISSAFVIAADQLVKNLVRSSMDVYETRDFIPGFVSLFHTQNTGASFSILREHTWLLALISAVACAVIMWLLISPGIIKHSLGRWSLASVFGGAVGNLIDRLAFGSVTDMFSFDFVRFAIFNVADIFITCGGILFIAYLIFIYPKQDGRRDENA
jgi:signal peptidase II